MTITFTRSVKVGGVLTDADETPTIGIVRLDTNAEVVAPGTLMTKSTTSPAGRYYHTITAITGVTYRATYSIKVDGETYTSSSDQSALEYRIGDSDITGVIDFDPAVTNLTPFIAAAEELVTQLSETSAGSAFTDTRLKLIQTWLAAHFLAIRDPRYMSETMGAAGVSYATQVGLNLSLTPYGQQAQLLDTTGWLAWLDKHISQGKRGRIGITWLGTDQSSKVDFPYRFFNLIQ